METHNSELKNCQNCKFYKKHYFWVKERLVNTYTGHCIKRKRNKFVEYNRSCDKWAEIEESRTIPDEQLIKILKRTAKQINEISAVLKADN